ncbi:MAG: YggT family protein [Acidimicrobiales bacterium]|nr:YggT family protein [Acidimicrobiales bacterium]
MDAICILLQLYLYALFARILLSWFPTTPGGALASINAFLYTITEPVLGPLRRAIPPLRVGAAAIDLSPILVFFGLQILLGVLDCGSLF